MLLDIDSDYGYVIGVDISETRIRVGLFDLAMTERAKAVYPLNPAQHAVDEVVKNVATGLTAVLAEGGIDPAAVLGVGIGVPGIVEQDPEVLVHCQAYRWDAVPLERLLREHTALPLRVENGTRTMGQAEMWAGAGRGTRNTAVVLIGSGVGASLISRCGTCQGTVSRATEWGHTVVVVDGRRCRCGSAGCLEAYVSAEAILDRYGSPAATSAGGEESMLAELIAAADASPAANAVLAKTADYLGIGIGNLINLSNPERVILGGWAGLLLGGRLLPDIRESARRNSLRPSVRRRVDRTRPGRTRSGHLRCGNAPDGGLPQRRVPPTDQESARERRPALKTTAKAKPSCRTVPGDPDYQGAPERRLREPTERAERPACHPQS